MVDRIVEDPAGVAQQIFLGEWEAGNTDNVVPDIKLRHRDIGPYGDGLASPNGIIWLEEKDQDRDKRADIQRYHDDVRCPFTAEIDSLEKDKVDSIFKEMRRIQGTNLSKPGRNLTPQDLSFDEWEEIGSPVNWEGPRNIRRLINYEMIIYGQEIR